MDRTRIRREAKRSMRASIDLGDQKLPVVMPRVGNCQESGEVRSTIYQQFQTSLAPDGRSSSACAAA